MRPIHALLAPALALAALTPVPPAAAGPYDDVARATLLPGWQTARGARIAGLRIDLAPGWKTYWRAPGDAGIPPSFDWEGSENLKDVRVLWPAPEVFFANGLRSVGYKGSVILPLEIIPARPGEAVTLSAAIDMGVCEEVCLPLRIETGGHFPQGSGGPDIAISTALAAQPLNAQEAGAGKVTCGFEPAGDDALLVTLSVELPPQGGTEYAVVETANPAVWASEPVLTRDGSRLTATAELVHMETGSFAVDRSGLRLTVLGDTQATELTGCNGG